MSEIIKTVKGIAVGRGEIGRSGHYSIYEYIDLRDESGKVERVENIAMSPKMELELALGVCFQFADGKELNSVYKQNFLVGMQKFDGSIITDDRVMRYVTKTRFFLANMSSWVPVIGERALKQAKRMQAAQDQVGQFEPLEPKFISTVKKTKI